jgi:ankyrin repeat protein
MAANTDFIVSQSPPVPSNEILAPSHRSNQQHVRQGNDYQHVTVGEGGRAILGNVYADNFSLNVLGQSQRPENTEQEKKEDFMKSLRFDVMDSRLATIGIAHRNTCSWLYTRTEYLRWQDPKSRASHHGFLWIKGKPGAGKSTMMKHALRHAQSLDQSDTTILSFFFNARGHELEKTTEGMYRSLLHQVYTAFPNRLPGVPHSYPLDSNNSRQLPILQTMLRDALLNFGNTAEFICYIDALDECDEDSIRLAIEYFEDLGEFAISQNTRISICFASRHYPNITMRRYQGLNLDEQEDHHEDIQKFVEGKLGGTGRIHSELTREISERSSGVFLWATLVVQILNKKMDHGATRSQLKADLKAVPTGIEALLKSILMEESVFLLPSLLWVLFALPLGVSELYSAIMIGAEHFNLEIWDQTETTHEQMQRFILNSSKGLVEFSTEVTGEIFAQFIHESVREYLLNGGLSTLDDSLAENLEAKSHLRLAVWCQNCIELDPQRGLRNSQMFGGDLVSYALYSMYRHYEDAFKGGAIQLEFLDTVPRSTRSEVSRHLSSDPQSLLCLLLDSEQECTCLAEGLLRRHLRRSGQVDAHDTAHSDTTRTVASYLDVNSSCETIDAWTFFMGVNHSVLDRSKTILQLLLDCGADATLVDPVHTPLLYALEHNNCDIVELLLQHGASPRIARAQSPLEMALEKRCIRCVEMLLKSDTDAKGCTAEYGQEYDEPLINAILTEQQEAARLLLAYGGDPNGTVCERPLHLAIGRRDESMVRLLLEAGADTKAKDEMGRGPLHLLCLGGNCPFEDGFCKSSSIRKALLDAGAVYYATDMAEYTASMMAAEMGSPSVERLLIDRNFTNLTHKTALAIATKTGDFGPAWLLCKNGTDLNAIDSAHTTALITAVAMNHTCLVRLLLDAGADVNATDVTRRTALVVAVETAHLNITRLLLNRGARLGTHDQE